MYVWGIKMKYLKILLTITALIVMAVMINCGGGKGSDSGKSGEKQFLKFTGGPSGGTFQHFSNAMSIHLSKKIPNLKVSNQASEGSIENVRKINSKKADFGIAYSGDVYLASQGKLAGDDKTYSNVRALCFLYKAPAQLAVLKNGPVKSVADLKGKKIDIGGPGSGAAASAERYLKSVGLWGDNTVRSNLGYNKAAQAMKDGHIDAMWLLVGYPTSAIINLASTKDITLLDVLTPGLEAGFDKQHPYYQPLEIPANTYSGVGTATKSFFDSALWIANANVSEEVVYNALKEVFTKEGLEFLIKAKKTAKQMSIKGAVTGIVTPLHKGAEKFWKEHGLTIPDAAKAE